MPKNIFSIYKISNEIETEEILINEIETSLNGKPGINMHFIDKEGFKGYLFSYETIPIWADTIHELIQRPDENNNEPNYINFNFTNSNVSYILLKSITNNEISNIYAVTGGRGYNIIQNYIEKDFGLNLIPKLINNDDNVVKKVSENRLRGNHINLIRTNKNNTSINLESDYFNIYKEFELMVGEDVLNIFGFPFENEDNDELNNTKIINKHSICISKSISIDTLSEVIRNINELQFEGENFALNQFKKISSTEDDHEIYEKFSEVILNNNHENYSFEVFGNDVVEYRQNVKFQIISNEEIIHESETPIDWQTLSDIFNESFIKQCENPIEKFFYKSNIKTFDEIEETSTLSIINSLNGYLIDEENDETYYLINGNWCTLESSYLEVMEEKYQEICEYSRNYIENNIITEFESLEENYSEGINESDYNKKFKKDKSIICADRKPHKKPEIADLIAYNENTLFLFCLKTSMGGPECRDLYGQIETSSHIVKHNLKINREQTLKNYYEELINNNTNEIIEWKDFKELFKKNICYIAGFIRNFNETEPLDYVKVLTYNINQKLHDNGYDFILMDFNFENNNYQTDE